jgi:SAM-dependent methyltransferase
VPAGGGKPSHIVNMKRHLYSSILGRFLWFASRFGASEMFLKPLRLVFAPVIIPLLRPREFEFRGRTYSCFYARYNMTWVGERMVEIPLAKDWVDAGRGRRILEVGNVLSHYFPVTHTVVDKYERCDPGLRMDILDYCPPEPLDLILSISTFEHIGFDDESEGSSRDKILAAISHCRGLLAPAGRLVITVPTGYNPELDALVREGSLPCSEIHALIRTGRREWREGTVDEAFQHPYRHRFPYANAILVVGFSAWTTGGVGGGSGGPLLPDPSGPVTPG